MLNNKIYKVDGVGLLKPIVRQRGLVECEGQTCVFATLVTRRMCAMRGRDLDFDNYVGVDVTLCKYNRSD